MGEKIKTYATIAADTLSLVCIIVSGVCAICKGYILAGIVTLGVTVYTGYKEYKKWKDEGVF